MLLALISAAFVGRALAGQIATFLAAARRLSRGDFRQPVPVHGRDEFAELGREFNDMSEQLEAKIEEVGRKRQELDTAARYGGEELAMILSQTDASGAELLAERVREAIESLPVRRVDGKGSLRVTASFGVAAAPKSGSDRMDLIAAADAALYTAKRGGKNRVERAETALTEPFTRHR